MKKIGKKTIILLMGIIMMVDSISTYYAMDNAVETESIPVIDDTKDYSEEGEEIYNYEGNFVIKSYKVTEEEIKLGKELQELHTHESKTRHVHIFPHVHSIRNVVQQSAVSSSWRPSEVWVENTLFQDSANWPNVSWEISKSTTVEKSVFTEVGVTDSVVSSTIGSQYTKSHTISTSTTITFKVPYQKKGRVIVRYDRPYKTFECVTTYYSTDLAVSWEETGSGSAKGAPYNISANLETRNIQ